VIRSIGILGGGQLGRMLTLEAKRMGYRVVVLDPMPDAPAGQVADKQIIAPYDDLQAVRALGACMDVVTYEFENIEVTSVAALEDAGYRVRPSADVLRVTQDRVLEKSFVRAAGCATVDFADVRTLGELQLALDTVGVPGILKTALGGYDGKGQWVVRAHADAWEAFAVAGGKRLIYERFISFDMEVSIVCARDERGAMICFPVTENVHDRGVLVMSIVPARVGAEAARRVREAAETIGMKLGIVGTYCVEFFVVGDHVYVNEIAPRVHNSGHYSLDAMQISQYEAHLRALCDLPLVSSKLFMPAVMVNILGAGEGDVLSGVENLLRDPDVALHMYGKKHAALWRKMGHFTVLASTVQEACAKADAGRRLLSWMPESVGKKL
jgi:5-(carboxyamino)imidazole ribonucleotide synthase